MDSIRSSWWSITINNPTEADRDSLLKENWPSFVKYWKSQDEVGQNGTPHIQGALNTAQTRLSAVKGWLPRAHIEVAKDKVALLKYVEKADTAVAGTQVVLKADYIAMDSALMAIASNRPTYEEWFQKASLKEKATPHSFEKWEFWRAVNEILKEKPKAVGLFTNPQLERAWVNTRSVWIGLLYKTVRQDIVDEIKNEILNIQDGSDERAQLCASSEGEGTPVSPQGDGRSPAWSRDSFSNSSSS